MPKAEWLKALRPHCEVLSLYTWDNSWAQHCSQRWHINTNKPQGCQGTTVCPTVSLTLCFHLPSFIPLRAWERMQLQQVHFCCLNSTFGKCLHSSWGEEAQINITFLQSPKEASTLQWLLCSPEASSATWAPWAQESEPTLVCSCSDSLLGVLLPRQLLGKHPYWSMSCRTPIFANLSNSWVNHHCSYWVGKWTVCPAVWYTVLLVIALWTNFSQNRCSSNLW